LFFIIIVSNWATGTIIWSGTSRTFSSCFIFWRPHNLFCCVRSSRSSSTFTRVDSSRWTVAIDNVHSAIQTCIPNERQIHKAMRERAAWVEQEIACYSSKFRDLLVMPQFYCLSSLHILRSERPIPMKIRQIIQWFLTERRFNRRWSVLSAMTATD